MPAICSGNKINIKLKIIPTAKFIIKTFLNVSLTRFKLPAP